MYVLSATRERIELEPIETQVTRDTFSRSLTVRAAVDRERDPVNAAALVARAARTFFEIGSTEGVMAFATEPPPGPPPVVFREAHSGFMHVVYREIVIRFRHGVAKRVRQSILRKYGLEVRRGNPFVPDQVIIYDKARRHSGEKLLEASNDLAEMEEVIFAAPNFVSQFQRHAPPSVRAEEWHLRNTGAGGAKAGEDVNILEAWKVTTGENAIVVAVLDDGVDIDHPNLAPRIWRNPDAQSADKFGRDFFLPDTDPDHFNPRPKLFKDPFHLVNGNDIHGTPCAGVIAAAGVGGDSVGAAPGCRILPVKIFHADELAAGENVANAIRYAAANADILSCSWSGPINPDIQLALEDVGRIGRGGKGSAVFCAAGNDSGRPVGFPARDPNAIAVGASTDLGTLAFYSNVGPEIAFVAPSNGGRRGIFTTDVSIPNRGFNVGLSTQGGADGLHTNGFGGTSSATPLAAGVAALVLSVNPDLNRGELRNILAASADRIGTDHGTDGHSDRFGHGRINAGKAVQAALGSAEAVKATTEAIGMLPSAPPRAAAADSTAARGAKQAAGGRTYRAGVSSAKKGSPKKGAAAKRGARKR
jgi:subtilisin family serine protease